MSTGGVGIPRLQDLSYIEVAATQVAAGATLEQVRKALVSRAGEIARENDHDGSFDDRAWEAIATDPQKYIHNTVDVLKQLMRLGWLERSILPSSPSSAYLHVSDRFTMTASGTAWAALVSNDRRGAYNQLLGLLLNVHPQVESFLRAVGARPDSSSTHLTIPLLRWDSTTHTTEEKYLKELAQYVATATSSGSLSWRESSTTIETEVRRYVERIQARLHARGKTYTRKQFVKSCEEAVTKIAFAAAGAPLDYISMELLRRWMRFLGVVNFSYYAPGPSALRLWATARVSGRGNTTEIERKVGFQIRRSALEQLSLTWHSRKAEDPGQMYLPIWELRAAVCWQQKISDDEFDKAIAEALNGNYPDLGFRIHLDQASVRATPPSTRPLVLPTTGGVRRIFNIMTLITTHSKDK